jgi:hypothetical protein
VSDDLERRLPDVPAAFPRPDREVTEKVRRRVRSLARPGRPVRKSLAVVGALVLLASALGFSAGHWLTPSGTAATSISLDIKPREVEAYFATVNAYGAIATGVSGETVIIEGRDCSGPAWGAVAKVVTGNSGTWLAELGATSLTTFRARWKNGTSETVVVRVHPHVQLLADPVIHGRFSVNIAAGDFFEGRTGVFERRSGNRWIRVRSFTIHRSNSMGVPWSRAHFGATAKPGTFVRAVLPKAQAGRCFLAGFSNIVHV